MPLGIRGANPVWFEVDLQGKLFDDTFYMNVLENEIPYIPADIFTDPDLNTHAANPVRFLANGTLPIDIFYEEDKVYRLEFRQYIVPGVPSQADPLIYEVDNYVPGTGGVTPVDTVAFASSNQISNPQFAIMTLQSPTTIGGTNPAVIEVAPGWFLQLGGTGTVTISQVPLNNSNINPSNAPYALRLTMSGWTDGSVILRQRLFQNGMLWANKIVSSAVTAFINGAPQSITANLIDSNNSVLGTVLPLTSINEAWNEYTGYAQLPQTTNPNVPPSAYIDYQLLLPSNIDLYLTSFQLVVQDLPIQPSFEQDSINRQIDHTYHNSYPVVPIGAIIDFAGFIDPLHYYLCDGSTKDRVRDFPLFNAITFTDVPTLTSGMNTYLDNNWQQFHIGMAVESTAFPANTTITNIVGTSITVSNNATATGPATVRYFAWGNGDGSTTFNIPDFRGFVRAGANGTVLGSGSTNSVGQTGGSSSHTLTLAEMPIHHHGPLAGGLGFRVQVAAGGTVDGTSGTLNRYDAGTGDAGSGAAHSIVQPTSMVKTYIRYQ